MKKEELDDNFSRRHIFQRPLCGIADKNPMSSKKEFFPHKLTLKKISKTVHRMPQATNVISYNSGYYIFKSMLFYL